MSMSRSTSIFFISLLAIPLTYFVNNASFSYEPTQLFLIGVGALLGVCLLAYLAIRNGQAIDPILYVFILCMFSSVCDLIIGLENDGVITGFFSQYLKYGEPYLKTAYGTMICYWDGTAHYLCMIMMMAAQAWNQSFRNVGLYWAGSIGHSMVVLIPGSVIGVHGIKWSILLNTPYMVIPFYCAVRFLKERPVSTITAIQAEEYQKSLWRRPHDIVLVFLLGISVIVVSLRSFAVMGGQYGWMVNYMDNYEPYMKDPAMYPKVQMIVYLYYFVPYYMAAICGLIWPGQEWMPDWALLHAGAAAQAQVAHIGASLQWRTPYDLRVPRSQHVRIVFWSLNLFLLLVPQLLAYRCQTAPDFFKRIVDYGRRMSRRGSALPSPYRYQAASKQE